MARTPTVDNLKRELAATKPGFSLTRPFYESAELYARELELIWYRDWIFAGHDCEIQTAGDFFTLQLGAYSLIVTRDRTGEIRAHHNTCRHRGFKICASTKGNVKRHFVCPYHQWSYELDGRLARARDLTGTLDASEYGLKPAHVASVGGYIFVCVAKDAPDFAPFRAMVEPYLAPFNLKAAKVAHESRIVEHGNWKLVMENNRECYHCAGSHPELCRTFPESPIHSGLDVEGDEMAKVKDRLVADCEAHGLASHFQIADHGQYRIMRMPFLGDATAMTLSGKPAVAKALFAPRLSNIGDVMLFHFPTSWNHFTPDHALSFRMLPISPTETELVTKWLVHKDAVEGVDYDLKTLTEVWSATNAQDAALVEQNQRGIASPAYQPGPYSPVHEDGVIQFINWYKSTLVGRLDEPHSHGKGG